MPHPLPLDIADYLKREEKLATLREAGSTAQALSSGARLRQTGTTTGSASATRHFKRSTQWARRQRRPERRVDGDIQAVPSNGYKTWARCVCVQTSPATPDANECPRDGGATLSAGAPRELKEGKNPDLAVDDIVRRYSSCMRWDRELKRRVRQQVPTSCSNENIRQVAYRPFVKQHLYADRTFSQAPGQTRDIFPTPDSDNRVICVPGVGSTKPFSALVVDTMPYLELISKGQCFPRYAIRAAKREARPPTRRRA